MSSVKLTHDQQRAAESIGGPLLITAGAGSGKTRVLTERVVNATTGLPGHSPVDIGSLLAITFTEKAAGELAERVRAGLRVAGHAETARRVDGAWISTIHAMCARLLRAEALSVGIDPSFRVLDAVEGTRLRSLAFEQVAQEALDSDEGARELFGEYSFDQVAACVYALGSECRALGISPADIRPEPAESARAVVRHAADEFARLGCEFREADCAAGQLHAQACESLLNALRKAQDLDVDDLALGTIAWRILAEHQIPGTYKGVKELLGEHRDLRRSLLESCAASVTSRTSPSLLRLTGSWSDRFVELKRAGGWLDFNDLQVEAARALSDPELRDRWRRRFALTMVDEFQDTDALQLEIVRALAGDDLCTVGDERQSIYRFRGADVGVFREHEREMVRAGAERVELKANFRSHAAVLGFVNRLFGSDMLFGDSLIELEHGRPEPEPPLIEPGTPRVELLLAEKADRAAGSTRAAAADDIANRIALLVGARNGGESASIRRSDVVVLVPAYRHAQEYADALRRAGVASIVVGGSRFFECPEIHALRSLCRVIANRADEEALVLLAASELCGLSDHALLGMRRCVDAGAALTLWDALAACEMGPEDRSAADRLQRAVERAGDRAGSQPLADVILNAVEDLDYDLVLIAGGIEGGETYANVLKFTREASAFEESGGMGLASFIEYMDAKESFGEHEAPASLGGDAGEAVRVMSIHASKGLEFPVVVMPELGEGRGGGGGRIARWVLGAEPTIAMRLPSSWGALEDALTPEFRAMSEDDKAEEAEELKRLLYVGCTRAKEMLLLSGASPKKPQAVTMLALLRGALGIDEVADRDIDLPGGEKFRVTAVGANAPVEETPVEEATAVATTLPDTVTAKTAPRADADQRDLAREPDAGFALESTTPAAPARLSYTAVAAFEQCAARFQAERVLGMRSPGGLAAAPSKQLGLAVHRVLETYGESDPVDPDRMSAIARYYRLDAGLESRLQKAVEAYRSSSVAERVRGCALVRREAPFAVRLESDAGGFVLGGNIDVYAVSDNRALIVDYKTGDADIDDTELLGRYELQAACYALAALADGRDEVSVVFVRPEAPPADGDIKRVSFSFNAAELEPFARRITDAHAAMGRNKYPYRESRAEPGCRDCPVPRSACSAGPSQSAAD
jgi:ATP-dependent exoDNAse (exonuclease V) beta subunit